MMELLYSFLNDDKPMKAWQNQQYSRASDENQAVGIINEYFQAGCSKAVTDSISNPTDDRLDSLYLAYNLLRNSVERLGKKVPKPCEKSMEGVTQFRKNYEPKRYHEQMQALSLAYIEMKYQRKPDWVRCPLSDYLRKQPQEAEAKSTAQSPAEAQRILEDARQKAKKIEEEAEAGRQQILDSAMEEKEKLLNKAREDAEALKKEAEAEGYQLRAEAQTEAEHIKAEAEQKAEQRIADVEAHADDYAKAVLRPYFQQAGPESEADRTETVDIIQAKTEGVKATNDFQGAMMTTFGSALSEISAQFDNMKQELHQELRHWQEQLFKAEYGRIAECYINLCQMINQLSKQLEDELCLHESQYASAQQSLPKHITMLHEQYNRLETYRKTMAKAFTNLGLTIIEPLPGDEFDPYYHIAPDDGEAEEGTVARCILPGVAKLVKDEEPDIIIQAEVVLQKEESITNER